MPRLGQDVEKAPAVALAARCFLQAGWNAAVVDPCREAHLETKPEELLPKEHPHLTCDAALRPCPIQHRSVEVVHRFAGSLTSERWQ